MDSPYAITRTGYMMKTIESIGVSTKNLNHDIEECPSVEIEDTERS